MDGTTATAGNANAIEIDGATDVTIENCQINGTTGSGTGHGIYLNNVTNANVIGCQLTANKSSGVELAGAYAKVLIQDSVATANDIGFDFPTGTTPTGCLVKNCQALTNTTSGFEYIPATVGASFLGNEAQGNGANFTIPSITINLQQLDNATATYTQVTGVGAVLGSPLANLSIVP